jgi:hypothetical protein
MMQNAGCQLHLSMADSGKVSLDERFFATVRTRGTSIVYAGQVFGSRFLGG